MTNIVCEICRSFNVKESAVCVYEQHYIRMGMKGIIVKPLCESCRLRVMDIMNPCISNEFDGVTITDMRIKSFKEYADGVISRAS